MSRRDDIVFGRPTRLKVFVSSEMRSRKLEGARLAVAEAIEESGLHDAWYWERNGHAGPFSSKPVCVGHARTSDYLVLILGETLTEITREEYLAAKTEAAAVIVFIPKGCVRDAEAEAFLQREAMSSTYGTFGSIDELKRRVVDALMSHAVRSLRERQLDRQVSLGGVGATLNADLYAGESQ